MLYRIPLQAIRILQYVFGVSSADSLSGRSGTLSSLCGQRTVWRASLIHFFCQGGPVLHAPPHG
jgi:hypothetical protein